METLQQAQDDVAAYNQANPNTAYSVPQDDSGNDSSFSSTSDYSDSSGAGYSDDAGYGVGAKGGFFTKSKMTKQKPKKMKQGGLASRK